MGSAPCSDGGLGRGRDHLLDDLAATNDELGKEKAKVQAKNAELADEQAKVQARFDMAVLC